MSKVSIFWHRRDLRTTDNAGLYKALSSSSPVLPIFIFDKNILDQLEDEDDGRITFIFNELERLKERYREVGSDLLIRYGAPIDVWRELLTEFEIDRVFTNRDYEPYAHSRDKQIYNLLQEHGVEFIGTKDHVIFEKSEVVKDDGSPYLVFTPYSKKWKASLKPDSLSSFDSDGILGNTLKHIDDKSISISDLGFRKNEIELPSRKLPKDIIATYHETRDYPAIEGTTRLSVHLRFGTISIRSVAAYAQSHNPTFLNELIWRDFYQMILFHYPDCPDKAIKPAYDRIEWESNEDHYDAWRTGNTGYPLVDAGMRELNTTGHMHNRVRMVVASFLTKHLLLDWRIGERYFARKLMDFELASNVGGWQWAAGSGCDAAPYFRIFNPTSQLEKFDKDLKYVKRWVPEYGTKDYPSPIVDHKWARERALDRYKKGLNS